MAFPPDVQLVTVTCGSGSDFFGEDATVTAEVVPILGGTLKRLTHKETGSFMVKTAREFKGEVGQPATFTVPNSSQSETWVDGQGNFFKDWVYQVLIVVRAGNGKTDRWTQAFRPEPGQTHIDLDLVPDGAVGGGVSAPAPPVTSVNGRAGAVVIPEAVPLTSELVAENLTEAAVAEKLPERLSETALSAAIVETYEAGTPVGGPIPTVKPAGDTRPGVWEYIHNSDRGYLWHILAGPGFGSPAALMAFGVDNGNGSGILVVNKAPASNGITLSQRPTVINQAAFIGTQESTTDNAPLMRLSSNTSGAGHLLQLLAFGAATPTQRPFYFGDAGGQAGAIYAADGRLEWRRPIRLMAKGSTDHFLEVTENEAYAYGAVEAYTGRFGKKGMDLHSPSGGSALWRFALESGGSYLNVRTGAAGAFGAAPTYDIIKIQHQKIAFFGSTPVAKPAAITSPAADVAALKTAVDSIRSTLTTLGLTS